MSNENEDGLCPECAAEIERMMRKELIRIAKKYGDEFETADMAQTIVALAADLFLFSTKKCARTEEIMLLWSTLQTAINRRLELDNEDEEEEIDD